MQIAVASSQKTDAPSDFLFFRKPDETFTFFLSFLRRSSPVASIVLGNFHCVRREKKKKKKKEVGEEKFTRAGESL